MPSPDDILNFLPWRYGDPQPDHRRIADYLQAEVAADEPIERAAIAFVEHWDAVAILTATHLFIGYNKFFRCRIESFDLDDITDLEDAVQDRIDLVVKAPGRRFHARLLRTPEGEAFHAALVNRLRPTPSITFTPFDARRKPK